MRLKNLHIFIFVASFWGLNEGFSQQIGLTNQYLLNPYYINPAYSGTQDGLQGLLGFRKQWMGFKGSPTLKYFSLNSSIYKNMGLGASVNIEEFNIIEKLNTRLSYSYHLKISDNQVLSAGIDITYRENRLNAANLNIDQLNDPFIQNNTFYRGNSFDGNAGLLYKFKGLEVAFTALNLLERKTSLSSETGNSIYSSKRHFNAFVSYDWKVQEKLNLNPFGLVRYAINTPASIDGGLKAEWNNRIWLAMAYRNNQSFIGSVGLNIADYFQIGYSYEAGYGTDISSFYANTHEVYLGFTLYAKPQKKLDLLTTEEPFKKKVDSLAQAMDAKELEIQKINESQAEKEKKLNDQLKKLEDENNELKTKAIEVPAKTKEPENKASEPAVKESVESDFVTMDKLEKGHYIVVKSFLNKEFALNAVNEIKEKNYKPFLVYNKSRGYYYVYIEKLENLQSALKELDNIKKAGFKDAWLYLHQ